LDPWLDIDLKFRLFTIRGAIAMFSWAFRSDLVLSKIKGERPSERSLSIIVLDSFAPNRKTDDPEVDACQQERWNEFFEFLDHLLLFAGAAGDEGLFRIEFQVADKKIGAEAKLRSAVIN